MAVVYRGIDHVLHRPVAIKVLHKHLLAKAEARERFAREARVIARLRHPYIFEVYDYSGEDSERAFIVGELIDGVSLGKFLEDNGPFLPELAAMVIVGIGRALGHAHDCGVIHRDVKPENIMVRRDGTPKLMDFGIAHVMDNEHLTMTGAILGSPAYMSPEQVDGKALDARTDVFSLGTLFYQLTAGANPFDRPTPSGVLRAIAEAKVEDIRVRCPGFPDDLHKVIAKMMARDPAERYPDANAVVAVLSSVLGDVGLGNDQVLLIEFLAKPSAFVLRAKQIIVDARVARAARLLAEGKRPLAIREAGTALALDPESAKAKHIMEQARRSMTLRKTAIIATAALAIGAAAVLAGFGLSGIMSDDPLETRSAGRLALPDPAPADMRLVQVGGRRPLHDLGALDGDGAHTVKVRATTEIPQSQQLVAKTFPVTIQTYPPAVRIMVDGEFRGQGRVDDLALTAGRHEVLLSHPNCDVCRDVRRSIDVNPERPPQWPIRYSIEYKDAVLTVSGPAGANVFLNRETRPRGKTGQTIRIPMSQPTSQKSQIRVEFRDAPPRTQDVILGPGQSVAVEF